MLDYRMFEEELSCFMYKYMFASNDGMKKRRNGSTVIVIMFVKCSENGRGGACKNDSGRRVRCV